MISLCHYLFFLNTCISNDNVNARLLLMLLRLRLSFVSRKKDGGQRVCDKAIIGLVHRLLIVMSHACVAVRSVYIPYFPFSFATFKTKKDSYYYHVAINTITSELISRLKMGNHVHRRIKTITRHSRNG